MQTQGNYQDLKVLSLWFAQKLHGNTSLIIGMERRIDPRLDTYRLLLGVERSLVLANVKSGRFSHYFYIEKLLHITEDVVRTINLDWQQVLKAVSEASKTSYAKMALKRIFLEGLIGRNADVFHLAQEWICNDILIGLCQVFSITTEFFFLFLVFCLLSDSCDRWLEFRNSDGSIQIVRVPNHEITLGSSEL